MAVTLTELQRIPTSGARAVEAISVDGLELLAIPQLAVDIPGQDAGMNGGNSDTDLLLLRRDGGRYVPHSALSAPGGEDAEFFTIGAQHFLAVASIRSGAGPYRYVTESRIHEWHDGIFRPFQDVETFAAKQLPSRWAYNWHPFRVGREFFVAHADHLGPSVLYRWDGPNSSPTRI
jgi:hypothetical protein